MIAVFLATLIVVFACTTIGLAACELCRWRASWVSPAVGFALLLVAGGAVQHVPGRATTVAVGVAVVALAALALPGVRRGLTSGFGAGLPLAIGIGLITLLPFVVSGRAGILGAGDNDDMVQHLTSAYWLQTHDGHIPVLITQGYPLGPHGFAAALAQGTGMSLVHSFEGIMVAVLVLIAFAAMEALDGLPRLGRVIVAAMVGLCYLALSYLIQGAFKEIIEALLTLAFALGMRELVRAGVRPSWRQGIPLGLLAAATVYTYSFLGLAWPVAAAALLLVFEFVARRDSLRERWRATVPPALPAALGAAAAAAIVIAPQAHRILVFRSSSFNNEPVLGKGNLVYNHHISVAQALGVWLSPDYRYNPHAYALNATLLVIATIVGALALVWWLRRRDFAVPAALAATLLIYIEARLFRSPYSQAKALVIVAPFAALTLGGGALAGWRAVGRSLGEAQDRAAAIARLVLVRGALLAVLFGAFGSSFLALRDAYVSPSGHASELARIRAFTHGHPVLYMDIDDFAPWYMAGIDIGTGGLLYPTRTVLPHHTKRWHRAHPFDFDNWSPGILNMFRYVVEPNGTYRSAAPPNFKVVMRTRSFLVWARTGLTPLRLLIEPSGAPGATLNCGNPRGRALSRMKGVAGVLPRPLLRNWASWHSQPVSAGRSGTLTLRLPAGSWDMSLQYASATGLNVSGPGMSATLPAHTGRIGPFWFVGTLTHARAGPVTIRATAKRMNWFARLLGASGRTIAMNGRFNLPLQLAAFTRHGQPESLERVVPLRAACGRFVDWYQLT